MLGDVQAQLPRLPWVPGWCLQPSLNSHLILATFQETYVAGDMLTWAVGHYANFRGNMQTASRAIFILPGSLGIMYLYRPSQAGSMHTARFFLFRFRPIFLKCSWPYFRAKFRKKCIFSFLSLPVYFTHFFFGTQMVMMHNPFIVLTDWWLPSLRTFIIYYMNLLQSIVKRELVLSDVSVWLENILAARINPVWGCFEKVVSPQPCFFFFFLLG